MCILLRITRNLHELDKADIAVHTQAPELIGRLCLCIVDIQ